MQNATTEEQKEEARKLRAMAEEADAVADKDIHYRYLDIRKRTCLLCGNALLMFSFLVIASAGAFFSVKIFKSREQSLS